MANQHGDIAGFLKNLPVIAKGSGKETPFLGIDECLNRKEIRELVQVVEARGLVEMAMPLWYETRQKDDVITGTFLGGVDRDSRLREPNALIADIGTPVRHRSWTDYQVVLALVANFNPYDKLIVLSENIKMDVAGLRSLLNDVVGPALRDRADGLSLTGLFKRRRTPIEDYCRNVFDYIERGRFASGYDEILI
jgi:hypothetical protein